MNEQVLPWIALVIPWVGLALLLVLCLPLAVVQKLVLQVCAWSLRLALLSLVGAAAYLWFRPEQLPIGVTETLDNFPQLRAFLPSPGTRNFGISVAALLGAMFLPLLAVLDVSRKLAGWRRLDVVAAGPTAGTPLPAALAPQQGPIPAPRFIHRRAAANTMAEAASRKPLRAPTEGSDNLHIPPG